MRFRKVAVILLAFVLCATTCLAENAHFVFCRGVRLNMAWSDVLEKIPTLRDQTEYIQDSGWTALYYENFTLWNGHGGLTLFFPGPGDGKLKCAVYVNTSYDFETGARPVYDELTLQYGEPENVVDPEVLKKICIPAALTGPDYRLMLDSMNNGEWHVCAWYPDTSCAIYSLSDYDEILVITDTDYDLLDQQVLSSITSSNQ